MNKKNTAFYTRKIICIETKEVFLGSEWRKLGFDHVHAVAQKRENHCKNKHFLYYDEYIANPHKVYDKRQDMKGVWKKIPDYENYEVSDLGEVRKGCNIIKSFIGNNGYKTVHLCKHGKQKTVMVHRLVANVFLDNPNKLPCVNHKDENKLNNSVSNLEWCTYKYNSNYGSARTRLSNAMRGNRNNVIQENRRIYAMCIETKEICHLNEWKRKGFQNVGKVCKGICKQEKGFHFVIYNSPNKFLGGVK